MLSTEDLFEYFQKVEEESASFQRVLTFDEANAYLREHNMTPSSASE
ncbi:MAG: hypothetical protein OXF50_08745 [Caldilineaceae bacterium]|nr:hypothetical protein [Caldilineaceae bacterium]